MSDLTQEARRNRTISTMFIRCVKEGEPTDLGDIDIRNAFARAIGTPFPDQPGGYPTGLQIGFDISLDALGKSVVVSDCLLELAKLCGVQLGSSANRGHGRGPGVSDLTQEEARRNRTISDMFTRCAKGEGPTNLSGIDIRNAFTRAIGTPFPNQAGGYPTGLRIEFDICFDALGKSGAVDECLHELAKLCGVQLGYTD